MKKKAGVDKDDSKSRKAKFLTALGFGFFIDSAEDQALPMLFPAIRASLGLNYSALSIINSIRIILQTFSGPIWGMLADRYNRKWILVIGTGIWGFWTIGCGLVTDYWQLLVIRVIACLGLGCLYPAAFSMLADVFGPQRRGRAMGAISAIGMFGIVIGAVVFGELLSDPGDGWRWAFIILGLASILSGVVIAVLVRDPVRGGAEPELKEIITPEAAAKFRFQLVDVIEVLRNRTVWINFIQGVFIITPINALAAFFVTWLVDDRGFSMADAPLIFGGIVVSLAIGSLVGGIVADWADMKWPKAGRIAVSQVSIAAALPALVFLLTQATGLWTIIAVSSFAGFFLDWTRRGVKQPLVQNVIRPELRATAMALTEFFQGAVASIVIILFGSYADSYGLTQTLMILVCGFWSIGFFVSIAYYFVYPSEAETLRKLMESRREAIESAGQH
ncbi:MAG: MFS transporter [Proteobacteria bacterium]|nr:MFS transporter [Pseudomonadota bacterium]